MDKILNFYVIADTKIYKNHPDLTIEKYKFNYDDSEDISSLEDYLEDDEKLTLDNFEKICRKYLYEEIITGYSQGFIEAMILTEKQLKIIKNEQLSTS